MKKIVAIVIAVVTLLTMAGCEKKLEEDGTPVNDLLLESGILKVGMELKVPPMEALDEEMKPVGFDVDLIYAVAEKLGVKVEIVDTTEKNLLPSLGAKVYDCAISTIPITEDNQKEYYVTRPYADITLVKDQISNKEAEGQLGIFVSRKNGQLMLRIDKALEELRSEGKVSELSQQYFGTDITEGL